MWVTYDIDFIPATSPAAKDIKPARPIWMDVQNGETYPVFDVPRGSGTNGEYTYPDDAKDPYNGGPAKNVWTVDQDGTLIATAGHVHPGGLRDDLWLQARGRGRARRRGEAGHHRHRAPLLVGLALLRAGRPGVVGRDDVGDARRLARAGAQGRQALDHRDVRDRSSRRGTRAWGSWSCGWRPATAGKDPFTTVVNVPGILTHGHLPENDNHGGPTPDPKHYVDLTKLPSKMVPDGYVIDISNFAYASGDMSIATSVPTIKQGQSITFNNLDAPLGNGIWHTITDCDGPCDGSTGIAYPLANGPIIFDSGELGIGGPPASGVVTWSTPTEPAARHLHVLLPDPPVHAGCVPRRRQLTRAPRAQVALRRARRRRAGRRGAFVGVVRVRRPRARQAEAERGRHRPRPAARRPQTAAGTSCARRTRYVGYRIKELFGDAVLKHDAVGRTPTRSTGGLTIAGNRVTNAVVTADLRDLESDRAARDTYIQDNALETNKFPTGRFTLTKPISLPAPRRAGQGSARARPTGRLLLHGVTRPVTVTLDAPVERADDRRRRHRADHARRLPASTRPTRVIADVDDHGSFEFDLVFVPAPANA